MQTSVWDVPGFTGYGDLFEELDSTGNPLRSYYRAADLAAQKDNTGSYAFHWMDTGTVELLSDLNQADAVDYAFTAWGELLSVLNGTSTPLAWNGRWGYYGDNSARNWVRARHLDVLRGRWFSQDPLGLIDASDLYWYVANGPVMRADPGGLDWVTKGANFAAGVGDSLTFGLTYWVRQWFGQNQVVNTSSGAYIAGEATEFVVELGVTLGSAALKRGAAHIGSEAAHELAVEEFKKNGVNVLRERLRRAAYARARRENPGREVYVWIIRNHQNPLVGHPGVPGFAHPPACLPTAPLGAAANSARWNVQFIVRVGVGATRQEAKSLAREAANAAHYQWHLRQFTWFQRPLELLFNRNAVLGRPAATLFRQALTSRRR